MNYLFKVVAPDTGVELLQVEGEQDSVEWLHGLVTSAQEDGLDVKVLPLEVTA
jgi:hypothetical protein